MPTYYRLKEDVQLRGWDKLPFAVVNSRSKQVKFVSKSLMVTLGMCDELGPDFVGALPVASDNESLDCHSTHFRGGLAANRSRAAKMSRMTVKRLIRPRAQGMSTLGSHRVE